MSQHGKGSSYQLLQLVLKDPEYLVKRVNDLLKNDHIAISNMDISKPDSSDHQEGTIEGFLEKNYAEFSCLNKNSFHNWWAHVKSKPTWDFISTCSINKKKGLLIVEAKSHRNEMESEGKLINVDLREYQNWLGEIKALQSKIQQVKKHKFNLSVVELKSVLMQLNEIGVLEKTTIRSSLDKLRNHDTIGNAISEAKGALSVYAPNISISRDDHYQFSNRIAYTWKLAKSGIPVVLLYLGFLNDPAWMTKGDHFNSEEDWINIARSYFSKARAESLLDMQKITLDNECPMFFCVDAIDAINERSGH